MPEFDFSQLQTLKTPEAWIDKALKIPQENQKSPWFLRSSVIGIAASLVIVAAVVITLLLHTGGSQPPQPADVMPVQPATVASVTEQTTSADGSVSSTAPSGIPSAAATTKAAATAAAASGATVPATTKTAATATTAATVPPSQAATAASQPIVTQPATRPLTQPQTQTATQQQTEPTDDIETGIAPATEWFQGTVAVLLAYDSPFADKDAAYVRFDTKDGFCGVVRFTPPQGDVPAYENTEEFSPYDCGVYVPVGEPCTVTVYDNSGNRKTYSMVFPLAGTILLKV